ncbi:hypothetical protein IWQ61_007640 [Dispira simplex]|nr:hypothetical protein IWQ61_007640 [Dispira simplex]
MALRLPLRSWILRPSRRPLPVMVPIQASYSTKKTPLPTLSELTKPIAISRVRQRNLSELRTWLNQHGLPSDGKKDVLCNRVWSALQEKLTKSSISEPKISTSPADVRNTTDKASAEVSTPSKDPQPLSRTPASELMAEVSANPVLNASQEPLVERPTIDVKPTPSKSVSLPPTCSATHQNSTFSSKSKDNTIPMPQKVTPLMAQSAHIGTNVKPSPIQTPQPTSKHNSARATSNAIPNEQPRPLTSSPPTTRRPNNLAKYINVVIVSGLVGWLAYPNLKELSISQDLIA